MSGLPESVGVRGIVQVAHRRFFPDKHGHERVNGIYGYYGPWEKIDAENLLTDAGRDFLHLQGYETTGLGSNGGNFIALSSDSVAPSASDTAVAGEITTGGLDRQQGVVDHTAGTSITTIIKTFIATAAQVSVQKAGLLTASSGGTLVHEVAFTATTLAINDQIQLTWTVTLS